ncbi:hypothetical protein ACJQWK_09136 [Exserohilum turcicum]|uniref:Uncharacterized protein n=1 Tax=Exserohilum turcicum (strain 28A) TaxID=671987 RepID=R0IT14_EXST2|nr:uncharacterized protein SETTUDRAFT_168772 [Exserohilum turcica Et28A]EOA87980.1 hypothetical protein SETTUDRAFT_168772 [Exserohilum turcica Et28A]
MYQYPPHRNPEHVCGLYYAIPLIGCHVHKHFLPQVKLEAKATILATTSQTVLTQTFVNPSHEKGIRECRYTFPLYDGVSVVGFTCHVGDRKIVGLVKEREKARTDFNEAVARGETAGLLEQLPEASDVFSTTVGNIPPGAKVVITITYLGELKHDMEIDGIRFTIPNIICPRYGDYPGNLQRSSATDAMGHSISITVDAEMADGSFIQKIQSPTHPIAVTMGTNSIAPNADPTMTKASATLTLGTAGLETDFVLQVIAKNTGVPKAILENHPRIANHRALMATLVPKFALPPEKPEIVFVCDRSGSMGGTRIELAKQALKVFLKSLPIGVKFNICSFGWQHSFLWPQSVAYSQQTLDEAMYHADSFAANYGGTEMLEPLKATIEQRYKDMPLDIMLLTDGEDWRQQNLFSYLNKTIIETKAPIRVFTLGIGNGVSHAAIEGIARAGNGFSQAVGEGEVMNTKVVRMLKGALSPHVNDYTLEVKCNNDEISAHLDVEAEDDFEIIERACDSLKVKLDFSNEDDEKEQTKKPISLFDPLADPDEEAEPAHDETGENRYAHLPKLAVPNMIQAPQNIPSLFAFHRTTVYLLLGPGAPQGTPTSVILRGTSAHGPLELEIPIQMLDKPGETIHQLAAKKAISELEQGRGWLAEAKDESETLIKTKFEGRYQDMVEREAVRLGVQFQVGGKWSSFVAVETSPKEAGAEQKNAQNWECLEDEMEEIVPIQQPMIAPNPPGFNHNSGIASHPGYGAAPPPTPANQAKPFSAIGSSGTMLFGSSRPSSGGGVAFGQSNQSSGGSLFGASNTKSGNLFGTANTGGNNLFAAPPPPRSTATSSFGASNSTGGGLFGSSTPSNSGGSLFGASNANSSVSFGNTNSSGSSLFGAVAAQSSASSGAAPSTQDWVFPSLGPTNSGGLFGAPAQQQSHNGTSLFAANQPSHPVFGAAAPSTQDKSPLERYQTGLMRLEQQNKKRNLLARQEYNDAQAIQDHPAAPPAGRAKIVEIELDFAPGPTGAQNSALFGSATPSSNNNNNNNNNNTNNNNSSSSTSTASGPLSGETLLHHLIALQSFSGSWSLTPDLLRVLGVSSVRVQAEIDNNPNNPNPNPPCNSSNSGSGSEDNDAAKLDETVFATALVIAVFQDRLAASKGSWELVVDKARSWLHAQLGGHDHDHDHDDAVEKCLKRARNVSN